MAQWSSRKRLKRVRVGRFKKGLSFRVFTKLQRLHVGVKVGFKIFVEIMCSKGHCSLFFLKIRKKSLDYYFLNNERYVKRINLKKDKYANFKRILNKEIPDYYVELTLLRGK